MRPRIESWEAVASHLRRLVSPKLGKKIAAEVTRSDIAELSNDIIDGKFGVASVSNARHMRRAVSGMYNWAAEAGRDYVPATCQPCLKLPKLPREHARDRVLTAEEIRIFWHGLDRLDLPWDRGTRLALKLSNKQFVFATPRGDAPLERKAMATALRGTRNKDGTVRTPGICALLGLKPFRAHDLRRTAATLAGDLGFSDAWIAKCLDHAVAKDDNGTRVPTVTGRVYNHSKRMQQKRKVLDGVTAALREIVGAPAKQASSAIFKGIVE